MAEEYDVWKEIEIDEKDAPCGSSKFPFKAFGLYGKQYPRLVIKVVDNGVEMWLLCYKQASEGANWTNKAIPLSLKKTVKEML